jgi:hypothetical protein
MAIGAGNLILAADYNGIQSQVASTLGTGTGDRGYGQAVTSTSVAQNGLITAQHMINLKTDIDKVSFHQTNSASSAPAVNVGGTILASDWTTYNTQITNLTNTRLNIFGAEASGTSPVVTSQSTWLLDVVTSAVSNWNGNKTHTITVNFGSADAARYFFNSGGEIRLVPRHSGETSSTSKGGRWKSMFTSLGIYGVRIRANSTLCAGGTPTTNVGWYQLTSTNTKIFEKIDTGTYSGNDFTVLARTPSAGQMIIDALFRDDGTYGALYDEAVDGTTTSSVGSFRATGSYVSVSAPTITAVAM